MKRLISLILLVSLAYTIAFPAVISADEGALNTALTVTNFSKYKGITANPFPQSMTGWETSGTGWLDAGVDGTNRLAVNTYVSNGLSKAIYTANKFGNSYVIKSREMLFGYYDDAFAYNYFNYTDENNCYYVSYKNKAGLFEIHKVSEGVDTVIGSTTYIGGGTHFTPTKYDIYNIEITYSAGNITAVLSFDSNTSAPYTAGDILATATASDSTFTQGYVGLGVKNNTYRWYSYSVVEIVPEVSAFSGIYNMDFTDENVLDKWTDTEKLSIEGGNSVKFVSGGSYLTLLKDIKPEGNYSIDMQYTRRSNRNFIVFNYVDDTHYYALRLWKYVPNLSGNHIDLLQYNGSATPTVLYSYVHGEPASGDDSLAYKPMNIKISHSAESEITVACSALINSVDTPLFERTVTGTGPTGGSFGMKFVDAAVGVISKLTIDAQRLVVAGEKLLSGIDEITLADAAGEDVLLKLDILNNGSEDDYMFLAAVKDADDCIMTVGTAIYTAAQLTAAPEINLSVPQSVDENCKIVLYCWNGAFCPLCQSKTME